MFSKISFVQLKIRKKVLQLCSLKLKRNMCKPAHVISKGFDRSLEFNGRALSVTLRHSNCFLKRLHVFLIFFIIKKCQKILFCVTFRGVCWTQLNICEGAILRKKLFSQKSSITIFAKKLHRSFLTGFLTGFWIFEYACDFTFAEKGRLKLFYFLPE